MANGSSASNELVWNGDQALAFIECAIVTNVQRASEYVRRDVVKRLNRSQASVRHGNRLVGLDPSRPGEPPKRLTNRLIQSIASEVLVDSEHILGRVGTNVVYARALELGYAPHKLEPRPYLRPALYGNERQIIAIVRGAMR